MGGEIPRREHHIRARIEVVDMRHSPLELSICGHSPLTQLTVTNYMQVCDLRNEHGSLLHWLLEVRRLAPRRKPNAHASGAKAAPRRLQAIDTSCSPLPLVTHQEAPARPAPPTAGRWSCLLVCGTWGRNAARGRSKGRRCRRSARATRLSAVNALCQPRPLLRSCLAAALARG